MVGLAGKFVQGLFQIAARHAYVVREERLERETSKLGGIFLLMFTNVYR